jgi:hypothetical protein
MLESDRGLLYMELRNGRMPVCLDFLGMLLLEMKFFCGSRQPIGLIANEQSQSPACRKHFFS